MRAVGSGPVGRPDPGSGEQLLGCVIDERSFRGFCREEAPQAHGEEEAPQAAQTHPRPASQSRQVGHQPVGLLAKCLTASMPAEMPFEASASASRLIAFPSGEELLHRLMLVADLSRAARLRPTDSNAEVEGVPVALLYGLDSADVHGADVHGGDVHGNGLAELLASAFGNELLSVRDALRRLRSVFATHLAFLEEPAWGTAGREFSCAPREQAYLQVLAGRRNASAVLAGFREQDDPRDAGPRSVDSGKSEHREERREGRRRFPGGVQASYTPPSSHERQFAPWRAPDRAADLGRSLN